MKVIAVISMMLGMFLAIGTAGSSDLDVISESQYLIQMAISIVLMAIPTGILMKYGER